MPNATVRANAQAMPMNRRGTLSTLAAAMLAAPRAAKAADLDADLFALAPNIDVAERELEALLAVLNEVQEKRYARRRPKPDEPELDQAVTQAIVELATQMAELQKSERVASEAYREALRQWQAEDERAKADSGVTEAEAALEAAQDVVTELQSLVAGTPARTLAGLIFKARYAADRDLDPVVMESIVDDLLALAEEA